MKKMINIRNSVIIILCITIICMAIGFIVVSIELKKQKDIKNSFNVEFTKIVKSSSVKGSTTEPIGLAQIDNNRHLIHMNFQLNATHDELIYTATIKNTGNIAAKIIDIIESPNYHDKQFSKLIDPITIQISELENRVLQPEEEVELKIIVYYNPSSLEHNKKEFNYSLGLLTKSVS